MWIFCNAQISHVQKQYAILAKLILKTAKFAKRRVFSKKLQTQISKNKTHSLWSSHKSIHVLRASVKKAWIFLNSKSILRKNVISIISVIFAKFLSRVRIMSKFIWNMIAVRFNFCVKNAAKFSQENSLKAISMSVTLRILAQKKFQFFIKWLLCGFGEIFIYFSQKFTEFLTDSLKT